MKINKKSAILGGAFGAVAVAGALIAGPVLADDTSTSTSPGTGLQRHMDGRGFGGEMHGNNGVGPMLHSEGVAASTDSNGNVTYVTVREQSGKVTASSDSSITVKSDDGYSKTWAIDSATIVTKDGSTVKASSFAVGDVVRVSGTVDGDAVTTTFVGGGTFAGGPDGMGRHGHGGPDMDGDGPMAGGSSTGTLAPVPSASSTTA